MAEQKSASTGSAIYQNSQDSILHRNRNRNQNGNGNGNGDDLDHDLPSNQFTQVIGNQDHFVVFFVGFNGCFCCTIQEKNEFFLFFVNIYSGNDVPFQKSIMKTDEQYYIQKFRAAPEQENKFQNDENSQQQDGIDVFPEGGERGEGGDGHMYGAVSVKISKEEENEKATAVIRAHLKKFKAVVGDELMPFLVCILYSFLACVFFFFLYYTYTSCVLFILFVGAQCRRYFCYV